MKFQFGIHNDYAFKSSINPSISRIRQKITSSNVEFIKERQFVDENEIFVKIDKQLTIVDQSVLKDTWPSMNFLL